MKDWYQYKLWISPIESSLENQGTWHIIRRHYYQIAAAQWRMVYFGSPRVGPIHTPKYWTHRWRIDINTSHGILPMEYSLENQGTWHFIRRHYYQIAAAHLWMAHFGTPRVGPIHTPNIGPIDEGLISNQPRNLTHRVQLRESMHMTYHTTALLPNSCGPMVDGLFSVTPRVGPANTPNIGPIDEGLITRPAMESHP